MPIAYLIDPETSSISEVETDYSSRSIYKLIDAQLFDVVYINDQRDVIYVDDEGLFHSKHFFRIEGYPSPLAGKGLVLGTDNEGETISPISETIETLEAKITFITSEVAIKMAEVLDAVNEEQKKIYGDSYIALPVADIIKDQV